MVKSLFTAQRFTSQIIELHHFLPLQTSVLAIYARLFTITMNIASGLGMDTDQIIQHGGQLKSQKKKKLMNVDVNKQGDMIGEVVLNDTRNDLSEEMGVHGTELGERIERPSITPQLPENSLSTSRRQSPVSKSNNTQSNRTSPQIEQPTSLSSRSLSPLISAQPGLREDDGSIPPRLSDTTVSVNVHDDTDTMKDGRMEGTPKKKKKRSHDLGFLFDSISSHAQSPKVEEEELPNDPNESKEKNKIGITALAEKLEKPKKKRKKKDAMDDIFGF
ncbi:hypothetical protein I204_05498 [Kwoniella mangroviensis CBS 8886]|nr:hypothetical protein I204_05498 [Kwoniella mangroviensis CBS 8886]